jgi:hypothetical protein
VIRSAEKGASGRGVAAAGLLEILMDKVMDAAIVGLKDTEGAEYIVPKHVAEGKRCLSLIDPLLALIERVRQLHCQACPVTRRGSLRSAGRKRSARSETSNVGTQTEEAKGPTVPPLSVNGAFDAAGFFKALGPGNSDQDGILLKKKHITATHALVMELSAFKAESKKTSGQRSSSKEQTAAAVPSNAVASQAPPPTARAAATQTVAMPRTSKTTQTNKTPPPSAREGTKEEPKRSSSKECSQQTCIATQARATQTESAVSDQAKTYRILRVEKRQASEKPEKQLEVEENTSATSAGDASGGLQVASTPAATPTATECNSISTQEAVSAPVNTCSALQEPAVSTVGSNSSTAGTSRRRNERQAEVRSKSKTEQAPLLRCPHSHGMQWIYRKELEVALACMRCQSAINGMDGFHFCAICNHDTKERHSICAKCSSDERIGKTYCQQIAKSASDGSLTASAASRAQAKTIVRPKDWALVSAAYKSSSP